MKSKNLKSSNTYASGYFATILQNLSKISILDHRGVLSYVYDEMYR